MRPIGDVGFCKEMAVQLLRQPQWQDEQGGRPELAEVNEHGVEKADPTQPVEREVHPHQPGDGSGCSDNGYVRALIERKMQQVCGQPGGEVHAQIQLGAQDSFQGKAEQEQKYHVAEQVIPATVQELAGDKGERPGFSRCHAAFYAAQAISLRFKFPAVFRPVCLFIGYSNAAVVPALAQVMIKATVKENTLSQINIPLCSAQLRQF